MLTTVQQAELIDLLNKYRQCFALSLSELGCTDVGAMEIKLKPGSEPYAAKPYRVSPNERDEISQHIRRWKEQGIVEDTASPHAAPVLLVRKKTGESRLVVDYRRLNEQTVKQVYPLPNIDDLLERMAGSCMYTVLDLAHGYLQIPLAEQARPLTGFITPEDTGQFTRMVFGLRNAPFEFAKIMDRTTGPLKNNIVLNYFDDYFIPAKNWDDMRGRLAQVLEAFSEAKLTLRPSKCVFAAKSIEFLGYVLSSDGLSTRVAKLQAIKEYPVPKDEHGMRRFMGLASFFRRFVAKFSEKARPLTELTKKNVLFQWGEAEQRSCDLIKRSLIGEPVLKLFDATKETELHTDASSHGLAGMLMQKDEAGHLNLVHCFSKKTSDTEAKYHSSKLELMAIVWSLDRMRSWLIGIHVTIVTDCQALVYMNGLKTTNLQITRWFDLLQDFDIEVKHRPGASMSHVDALSRAPTETSSDTLDELISNHLEVLEVMSEEQYVKSMQYSDPELRQVIDNLSQGVPTKPNSINYELTNGVLYRVIQTVSGQQRLWMEPKCMRKSLVIMFHDQSGILLWTEK